MVLAPLTTPAHFTGRRSGPPVKGQAAPLSPTAASPRSRLRAWRGKSFGEDAVPSPGAVRRSIFSLDPKELAALFLEAPAQEPGKPEGEKDTGHQEPSEGFLPNLDVSWDQQAWTSECSAGGDEESRYVVVHEPEAGDAPMGGAEAMVARELVQDVKQGVRCRERLVAAGVAAGAGLVSFVLFSMLKPEPAASEE